MTELFYAYQPLIDIFLLNCGFAFSQYIILRAGVFSVATVGIVAIGAYITAIAIGQHGVSIWLAAPVSAVAGLVVGLLLSIPLARLRGPYQAIATLAFVEIVIAVALYDEGLTGGAMGINNIPKTVSTPGLLLGVVIVLYFLIAIGGTRIGRTFDAVRQDERVAGALGVSVTFYHALAFGISGAIAGLFGALEAANTYSIEPTQFGFTLLTTVLAAVVLGGRRSVGGPIVGAAIMTFLPELARPLADNRPFVNGLLLVVVIIFLPGGIVDGFPDLRRRLAGSRKALHPRKRPQESVGG